MPAQMSPLPAAGADPPDRQLAYHVVRPEDDAGIVEVGDRPVLDRNVRMAVVGDPSGPGRARIRAVDRVTVEIDRDAVRTHDEAVHGTVEEVVRERRALRQGLAAGDRRSAMGTTARQGPERPPRRRPATTQNVRFILLLLSSSDLRTGRYEPQGEGEGVREAARISPLARLRHGRKVPDYDTAQSLSLSLRSQSVGFAPP